jgi:hypothetical protein
MLRRKATNLFVIPAPAFAGVNLSPQKRGAGIQKQKKQGWIPACAGMTESKRTFSTEQI